MLSAKYYSLKGAAAVVVLRKCLARKSGFEKYSIRHLLHTSAAAACRLQPPPPYCEQRAKITEKVHKPP